jgi:RHS repeat-associated protein
MYLRFRPLRVSAGSGSA